MSYLTYATVGRKLYLLQVLKPIKMGKSDRFIDKDFVFLCNLLTVLFLLIFLLILVKLIVKFRRVLKRKVLLKANVKIVTFRYRN